MEREDGTFRKVRKSYNIPGQAHELTFSCYKRLPLLSKDRTREWFIEALENARQRWQFDLWAYVILPEHAHVLLLPRQDEYDISLIVKAIKLPVARKALDHLRGNSPEWLARLAVPTSKAQVEYRFWQAGGGYDRNIECVTTAWNSVEYIHNNPIRRGLVSRAIDWEWSSVRFYAGEPNCKLAMDGRPPNA